MSSVAGLMYNDILYEDQDVKEALKRLPENVYHDRNFRISRALHLSMTHRILPKEQWTKYEEVCSQENSLTCILFSVGFIKKDNCVKPGLPFA